MNHTDGRLQEADRPTEPLKPVEPGCRLLDVMEEEEEAEEELVPGAHDKQNRLGGVVDPEDGVPREVDALMTGGACYCRAVQVQPVAGDVHTHAELEEEDVGRVEQRQVDQQTHGGTAVRQHVHHGSKLSALVEGSGRVSVQRVQQGAEQVAEDGGPGTAGHQSEGQQGQEDTAVTDQIGDEEEDVFLRHLGCFPFRLCRLSVSSRFGSFSSSVLTAFLKEKLN